MKRVLLLVLMILVPLFAAEAPTEINWQHWARYFEALAEIKDLEQRPDVKAYLAAIAKENTAVKILMEDCGPEGKPNVEPNGEPTPCVPKDAPKAKN